MSAREVLKTITEETPIPIIVNNDTGIFLLEPLCSWLSCIHEYLECHNQRLPPMQD